MTTTAPYRSLSLWHDTTPDPWTPADPLDTSIEVDVGIVGGGYTGLWTAYYLSEALPDLRIAIVEAEVCGYGASGRNGGWATHEFSIDRENTAARCGRADVEALLNEMCSTVDEIGRVIQREHIDADYAKGGTVTFASAPAHVPRLRQQVEYEHRWGFDDTDFRWLSRADALALGEAAGTLGALYTPHCAAVHPAKLVKGLVAGVTGRGVRIFEQTRAIILEPGVIRTDRGNVRARHVLRCTEAFTVRLPGSQRETVPLYSLMIATAPLPEAVWSEIGLAQRPTFNDGRHLIIYGQRTADGRFAFGGRGAPYHFGSTIRPEFDLNQGTHHELEKVLRGLFPQIGDVPITHRWGGAVAVPRDWQASITYDPSTGVGRAGNYVGVGVAASNLAGRTLADLVLGRDTRLTTLPWVGHRSPSWEPEPIRWLGINAGRMLAPAADAIEKKTGRPSRVVGGLLHWLTGH